MVVLFIKTNIQSKLMKTSTMIPCSTSQGGNEPFILERDSLLFIINSIPSFRIRSVFYAI